MALLLCFLVPTLAEAVARSAFLQKAATSFLTAQYSPTLYDEWAAQYDALDGGPVAKALGIEDMRRRYLGQHARGAVLDVGAGTGLNAPWLHSASSLSLVDLSEGMLQQARIKLPFAKFYIADAAALPFTDNQFDTVLETFCLCVVDDPYTVLTEMHRVVKKPEGTVILIDNSRPQNPLAAAVLDLGATTQSGDSLNKQCRPDLDLPLLLSRLDSLFTIRESDTFGAGFYRAYLLSPR